MNYKLYVWRTGLAQVDVENSPKYDGTIVVGVGDKETLESCLVTGCRLMEDGSGYLVNGIPEAQTDEEALDALEIFKLIVQNKLNGIKAFNGVIELKQKQRRL